MKNVRTIILAAGKGVRMKSRVPKVLHPVCGKAIIDYVLEIAKSVGSLKTYAVVGHKQDLVKKHIGSSVKVVIQKRLLGTADAIRSTSNHFRGYKGHVLILSGDVPLLTRKTVKGLIAKHIRAKADCTFITSFVQDPGGYGRIIRNNAKRVVAIREQKDAKRHERDIKEINAGVYCFKVSALFHAIKSVTINKKKKEFYLTDIIEILTKKRAIVATTIVDITETIGVNTREDLAYVQAVMNARNINAVMNQGATVVDPSTTYIDSDVKLGRDTVIYPHTFIEKNVRIGKECSVGPFSHIRQQTKIGDRVEVGNFSEISRSKIGNNCFVKHFSFIGDSIIGNRVNIGAGVVTANFDGKNKYETRIGDDAFIGSDSILVAPVTIGKKASTGAGCVVTKKKNIPNGSVAMGVPAKIVSRKK